MGDCVCLLQVKRIFVGGVSSDSVNDDLKNYFEQFGKVSTMYREVAKLYMC